MRYFLISDNIDTLAGLRMAGVDGVVVHTPDEVKTALESVLQDKTVGLVLITTKLFGENQKMLFDYKLRLRQPLIVEMPDRHSGDDVAGNLKKFIGDVVGIKI